MIEDKIMIVIPYLASGAQGRELEYAVAGWRQHFQSPYHIVVVGDFDEHVHNLLPNEEDGSDMTFVSCPRIQPIPGQYTPHLDHVRKFRMVHALFPETRGFVYACDDMYAVNDFDIDDVIFLKALSRDMKGNALSTNGWQRDMAKTRELCVNEGYPVTNWICHLPVYFAWEPLLEIYDKYGCDTNSYVVENIYFNALYPTRRPFFLDLRTDNLKCGVYRQDPDIAVIRNAFDTKIWITNSPEGWVSALDRMLASHYGLK